MKTILIALLLLVVVVAGLLTLASLYFYDVAIKRSTKDFLAGNEDLNTPESEQTVAQSERWDWLASQTLESWQITSEDGLNLVGSYIAADSPTTKSVILAHGYASQGKDMESFAWFYRDILGFNVLMPDARGHGQSEGDYIGFGWHERKDYVLWIQMLIDKLGDDAQIALHGISMGGATVMMVSGEKLPDQVKVIVEDCGYTSAYDELAYQLRRMYKLPPIPILPATSVVTKLKAGFSLYEASALKQVEKATLPILFIHGDDDRFVPTEMVYRLYEACHSEKEIYIVEGAGHGHAYGTDRTAYVQIVGDFVGRFID